MQISEVQQVWKRVRDQLGPLLNDIKFAGSAEDKLFSVFALTLKARTADLEISKFPESALSLCARGDLARYLGSPADLARAGKFYAAAAARFPADGRPRNQLSVLYLALRRPLAAAAQLLWASSLGFVDRAEVVALFQRLSAKTLLDVPKPARAFAARLCGCVAGLPQPPPSPPADLEGWAESAATILSLSSAEPWAAAWAERLGLRNCLIVLDGLNVAKAIDKSFSAESLRAAADYYASRGHQVAVILPRYRFCEDVQLGHEVIWTPAKDNDDSYAIEFARRKGGCLVSNDMYRDWISRQPDQFDAQLWVTNHVVSFALSKDFDFIPKPEFAYPIS